MTHLQPQQEKWQELADAIGWDFNRVDMIGCGVYSQNTVTCEFFAAQPISETFRDAILASLATAKQRTPLELAAQEMANELLLIVGSCEYKEYRIEQILKKAGVL